jgi:hypothetical protein
MKTKTSLEDLQKTIEDSKVLIRNNQPINATNTLVCQLDDLFVEGNFDLAKTFLSMVDVDFFPARAVRGLLMIACHAREAFNYSEFEQRAYNALKNTWEYSDDEILNLKARFGEFKSV